MCARAEISTSGFYSFVRRIPIEDDASEIALITKIFHQRRRKAGARTIRMKLLRDYGMNMNLKKVRRIMRENKLVAVIRRKNKYAMILKAGEENKAVSNLLNREFEVKKPDTVYSTDITYLYYGKGSCVYLSAIKDLGTKEIVHHTVSNKMTLDLALKGLEDLYKKLPPKKRKRLIVHSDQGSHYTSKEYRSLLSSLGVQQSMSRKGNCLDNAPIESFFGHMKDELELYNCSSFEDIEMEIKRYISYYNNERPQWGLKAKTPAECRGSNFRVFY